MPLQPITVAFMKFLRANPSVKSQIRAGMDKTLLYSGSFGSSMWAQIDTQRRFRGELLDKRTLPDVLKRIAVPGTGHASLHAYVLDVEGKVPWHPDGFVMWRALSGLFAANAQGKVSFMIGSGIERDTKVFAATEVGVLMRNPNVDPVTKDLLSYYQRCIQSGESAINVGLITA